MRVWAVLAFYDHDIEEVLLAEVAVYEKEGGSELQDTQDYNGVMNEPRVQDNIVLRVPHSQPRPFMVPILSLQNHEVVVSIIQKKE